MGMFDQRAPQGMLGSPQERFMQNAAAARHQADTARQNAPDLATAYFQWFNRQPPIDPIELGTRSAMGFMPMGSIRAFHGSDSPVIEQFRLPGRGEKVVFASSSADEAAKFGEHVHDLEISPKRISEVKWSEYNQDPIYTPEIMKKILEDNKGADAIKISGVRNFEGGPKTTTYAITDPAIISILRKYGMPGLLTGGAAAGAAGEQQ